MTLKNRYIQVESSFESELVQTLLFEAGASWQFSGKNFVPVYDCNIVIDGSLEMSTREGIIPLPDGYKELSLAELVEIVKQNASEVDNSYYVCEFSDNHIRFEGSEVDLTIDEMSELLQVIRSLSHRDFEITTIDEINCDSNQTFPLTNLTIHFK